MKHEQRIKLPFCILQTQDTDSNVIDILYNDTKKKSKLTIATKLDFEIKGDVDLFAEDLMAPPMNSSFNG